MATGHWPAKGKKMKLFELIPFLSKNQKEIKVHCATGSKDIYAPKNAFLTGNFKNWQENQTQKNFERKFILSLIYWNKDEWLFAGIYENLSVKEVNGICKYKYETKLTNIAEEFIGKLIVDFKKDFRASYLCLENQIDKFYVLELKREIAKVEFPGYDKVNVSWKELSELIDTVAWKTALENQKGVYLIVDTSNGKKYVGSAYGEKMLHGRWKDYVQTGNGGNIELKGLSFDYIKNNFKYSILEIFKSTTDDETIIGRESWWKEVLLTRGSFGYNKN